MATATTAPPFLVAVGRIPVQKLFLVAIILKVVSSGLGWWFEMPWTLGLAVPLTILAIYIVLGWRRQGSDVPDDKFADSCYYLGFIFTITSIIFSLFDLKHIELRFGDIAIRFGAAMIATVMGLVARVYLVSFKRDATDAIETVESSVIESAERFRVQLDLVNEKFQRYESEVVRATEVAAARVDLAMENNATALNGQLMAFFTELSQDLKAQAKVQIATISTTTKRLEAAAQVTIDKVGGGLRKLDEELNALLAALRDRVNTTTLPEDHFTRALVAPLEKLRQTASELAAAVGYAEAAVSESADHLTEQTSKLGTAGEQLQDALGVVEAATKVQATTQRQFDAHVTTLQEVRTALTEVAESNRAHASTKAHFDAHLAALQEVRITLRAVAEASKTQALTPAHFEAQRTTLQEVRAALHAVESAIKRAATPPAANPAVSPAQLQPSPLSAAIRDSLAPELAPTSNAAAMRGQDWRLPDVPTRVPMRNVEEGISTSRTPQAAAPESTAAPVAVGVDAKRFVTPPTAAADGVAPTMTAEPRVDPIVAPTPTDPTR